MGGNGLRVAGGVAKKSLKKFAASSSGNLVGGIIEVLH